MKRPKTRRKSARKLIYPDVNPKELKRLKRLMPKLNNKQCIQLHWEIGEIAKILLDLDRAG
jgi:hypothetical protein